MHQANRQSRPVQSHRIETPAEAIQQDQILTVSKPHYNQGHPRGRAQASSAR